jgi:hypothetical protein
MSNLLIDIKSLMTGISNVYIGSHPPTPDNVVTLYSTGGYPRSLTESEIEEPTFQIRVRNSVYATGYELCNTIKDLLHGAKSTRVLCVYQVGDILDIGRDENGRTEWTINYRAYYKR